MAKKATTRRRGRGRRAHQQRLQVSGLKFVPARCKADGSRAGHARTTLTLSTTDVQDPGELLELVGTVQDGELELVIAPDDSQEWRGPARILSSSIRAPGEGGEGRYSVVVIAIEVVTDNPQAHLDLFECRLAMDGRDNWEALCSMQLVQENFTLPGGLALVQEGEE